MVLLPEDMTLQEIIGRLSALAEHSNPRCCLTAPKLRGALLVELLFWPSALRRLKLRAKAGRWCRSN